MPQNKAAFRTSSSGATRDLNDGKKQYDKFIHPLVIERFADYMQGKRAMPDGSSREGDNWWNGFPREWLIESMGRHYQDTLLHTKGFHEATTEDEETALCGLLFNVQSMLMEVLLGRRVTVEDFDEDSDKCKLSRDREAGN